MSDDIDLDTLPVGAGVTCAAHIPSGSVMATWLLKVAGHAIPLCEKCADRLHDEAKSVRGWYCV